MTYDKTGGTPYLIRGAMRKWFAARYSNNSITRNPMTGGGGKSIQNGKINMNMWVILAIGALIWIFWNKYEEAAAAKKDAGAS